MIDFFDSKENALIISAALVIATLAMLAFFSFKAAFGSYVKYVIVKKEFHSDVIQGIVNNAHPRHELLKNQWLRYFLLGLTSSFSAVFLSVLIMFINK
ncbi:hypothetical protein ACTG16_22590 [Aeromonas sp. 23P]|uniref:hypothetical protein n=1 Tax=Aeromonas sp. 23P TaxID=3452716 RepID=UPI003F7ACBE9|nr:hypothetical protein [Aeromonas veronii]